MKLKFTMHRRSTIKKKKKNVFDRILLAQKLRISLSYTHIRSRIGETYRDTKKRTKKKRKKKKNNSKRKKSRSPGEDNNFESLTKPLEIKSAIRPRRVHTGNQQVLRNEISLKKQRTASTLSHLGITYLNSPDNLEPTPLHYPHLDSIK